MYPTFGFAVDLGSVSSTPVSTLFTIGLAQEQAVQFDGAQGNVNVPSLWTSYYPTELDAVSTRNTSSPLVSYTLATPHTSRSMAADLLLL